jgi:hypothetical protein
VLDAVERAPLTLTAVKALERGPLHTGYAGRDRACVKTERPGVFGDGLAIGIDR